MTLGILHKHKKGKKHKKRNLSTPALVGGSLTLDPMKCLLVGDVIILDKVWLADDDIRQEQFL